MDMNRKRKNEKLSILLLYSIDLLIISQIITTFVYQTNRGISYFINQALPLLALEKRVQLIVLSGDKIADSDQILIQLHFGEHIA